MLPHNRHLPASVFGVLGGRRLSRPPEAYRKPGSTDPGRSSPPFCLSLRLNSSSWFRRRRLVEGPGEPKRLGPKGAVRHGVDLGGGFARLLTRPSDPAEGTGHCAGRHTSLGFRLAYRYNDSPTDILSTSQLGSTCAEPRMVLPADTKNGSRERTMRSPVASPKHAFSPCDTQRAGLSMTLIDNPHSSAALRRARPNHPSIHRPQR